MRRSFYLFAFHIYQCPTSAYSILCSHDSQFSGRGTVCRFSPPMCDRHKSCNPAYRRSCSPYFDTRFIWISNDGDVRRWCFRRYTNHDYCECWLVGSGQHSSFIVGNSRIRRAPKSCHRNLGQWNGAQLSTLPCCKYIFLLTWNLYYHSGISIRSRIPRTLVRPPHTGARMDRKTCDLRNRISWRPSDPGWKTIDPRSMAKRTRFAHAVLWVWHSRIPIRVQI